MIKPLITLPCTAQELENALHAVCDHDGLWDSQIEFVHGEFVHGEVDINPVFCTITEIEPPRLVIETETKGEAK